MLHYPLTAVKRVFHSLDLLLAWVTVKSVRVWVAAVVVGCAFDGVCMVCVVKQCSMFCSVMDWTQHILACVPGCVRHM
jgi:hypothetical protein